MMQEDQSAKELFRLFCSISASMLKIRELLRSMPDASEIVGTTDIQGADDILEFEAYVDAEMSNGFAYSWGLNLRYEHHEWVVKGQLQKIDKYGGDRLQEFPQLRTESFKESVDGAFKAADWLVELAKRFNVADYT
jgi:hypothetical protein